MGRTVREWMQDSSAVVVAAVSILTLILGGVAGYTTAQVSQARLAWSDTEQSRRITDVEGRTTRLEDRMAAQEQILGRIDERTRLMGARMGVPEPEGGK